MPANRPTTAPRRSRRRAVAVALVATVAVLGAVLVRRVATSPVRLPPDVTLRPHDLAGITVVIDPGHGGTDPGAVAGRITEDALNYRMASTLAAVVRDAGGTVVFTVRSAALIELSRCCTEPPLRRAADAVAVAEPNHVLRAGRRYAGDLYVRAAVANTITGRVVFVSLHHDAGDSTRFGAHVLVDSRAPAPQLAGALMRRLAAAGLNGSIESRNLGVLRPSNNVVANRVLVELATITNPGELRAAKDPLWRWRVARTLAAAIRDTA